MVPTQKGLDPRDAAPAEISLGLVVEQQLVAFECPPQTGLEHQPLDRLGFDLPGMKSETIAALFLGRIHRRIGILSKRFFVLCVGREQ